jgi:phospholipid/cholesterol/gamma-HCH transport system ATP-binding protein
VSGERYDSVLSLDAARFPLERDGGLCPPMDLVLRAGDFVLVEVGELERGAAIADACSGLLPLGGGAARFQGRNWTAMPPAYADAMRGRIGRTFAADPWLEHLSVRDNVLLAQLHHTRADAATLVERAARLARRFGLPGLPVGRPHELANDDLQRAGLVRALLGEPALLLLESPVRGLFAELGEALVNTIGQARDRGAAVLWLTVNPNLWADASLPVTRRYRLIGGALVASRRRAA